jgi:hypothetical protein
MYKVLLANELKGLESTQETRGLQKIEWAGVC